MCLKALIRQKLILVPLIRIERYSESVSGTVLRWVRRSDIFSRPETALFPARGKAAGKQVRFRQKYLQYRQMSKDIRDSLLQRWTRYRIA